MRKIKRMNDSVVAVVSSGYSNDPVMANFGEYGFSGARVKPYRQEQVAGLFGEPGTAGKV